MKFYETSADEYISSIETYNLHSELIDTYNQNFPKNIKQFENTIVYGPIGSGKYSQVLYFLKKYSPSELKYEKKMTVQSDKQSYTFRISDIHYEIDMSFLGCNSKNLWYDIFLQIVDIISVKQEKIGIILCKNFHMIHSELLEIFYSYIQQFNSTHMNIQVKFILLTEHISFLQSNIINCCNILHIKKPSKEAFDKMIQTNNQYIANKRTFADKDNEKEKEKEKDKDSFIKRISSSQYKTQMKNREIIKSIDTNTLINIKELQSFSLIKHESEIPPDIFNTVCDQIIDEITMCDNIQFTHFRDSLYDILIYNLDITECVWYIISHFINSGKLQSADISDILQKTYMFLKYFNNNYRPIYHLESMMFYLITKLNGYDGKQVYSNHVKKNSVKNIKHK